MELVWHCGAFLGHSSLRLQNILFLQFGFITNLTFTPKAIRKEIMSKHILGILLITASISFNLAAQDAAAPAAIEAPATPVAWKENFDNGKTYVVQKVINDPQKSASFRKEYKDGSLVLYYKFAPSSPDKINGTFGYGIAKPIDLKGGTALEIRYRTPVKGISNIITWTYTDASGKRAGDWTRLPEATEWNTAKIVMNKDGFGGKKNAKPVPAKLITLEIYSTPKRDDVERSIEIDYISVPAPANE